MFEDAPELIVLVCFAFDVVLTAVLALLAIKWHRKYQFLKIENSLTVKRAIFLQKGNEMLKEVIEELKSRNIESNVRRAELVKENKDLSEKLSSANKKLSNFSKMINDMKNS